jgi:hypothetical protein
MQKESSREDWVYWGDFNWDTRAHWLAPKNIVDDWGGLPESKSRSYGLRGV